MKNLYIYLFFYTDYFLELINLMWTISFYFAYFLIFLTYSSSPIQPIKLYHKQRKNADFSKKNLHFFVLILVEWRTILILHYFFKKEKTIDKIFFIYFVNSLNKKRDIPLFTIYSILLRTFDLTFEDLLFLLFLS